MKIRANSTAVAAYFTLSLLTMLCCISTVRAQPMSAPEFCRVLLRNRDAGKTAPALTSKQVWSVMRQDPEGIALQEWRDGRLLPLPAPPLTDSTQEQDFLFVLGERLENNEAQEAEFQEIHWKRMKWDRDISFLEKQPDVRACVEAVGHLNLSEAELDQYRNAIAISKAYYSAQFAHILDSYLSGRARHPRLVAQGQLKVNVAALSRRLETEAQSKDTHLIFVLHGGTLGSLAGSDGLTVTDAFLEDLANFHHVKSVTLYCCYPERVAEFYSEALQALTSRGVRVFFPKNAGPMTGFQRIPYNSLPVFYRERLTGPR